MNNTEFQQLREYHLTKPDWKISSPLKGGRGRLSDLYREVRDVNWRRECERKKLDWENRKTIMELEADE